VSAQCQHGICRFSPLDLVVNDGKLHLAPVINVGQVPILLTHPSGKIIDQINLTPELCHNGLKYAAPILADATQVDGKLSLEAQSVALPLSSLTSGSATGVLTIHRAQSRPGPLGLQITSGSEQLKSIISRKAPADPNREQVWIEMSEQQIPIRLEQGRVHHQGMMFMVKDVMIRTSGSVGLDSSLNLVAEVPVREEWLGGNKVLAGLKGKAIQIPIVGTSSRPQIDPAFFANFAQQIGGSALEGLLQDKVGGDLNNVINNGLDKLLRGKK
jgi:translocation and assembly module TamB